MPPVTARPGQRRTIPRFFAGCLMFVGCLAGANPPAPLVATKLAPKSGPRGATLFTVVPPELSQVRTENRYADPRMWGELYHEFEVGPLGSGVAMGDYDGDGRPDLFVVSKTESCRLFRNLGDWKFEDVTERAGVGDRGAAAGIWKQGATFADVNNDGRLDLYVCRFDAPNLLYVNQGDGTFKEQAKAAGLDVTDATTMAAFCDYDRDGWLDVFVQTNLLNNAQRPAGQRDYLFRNNRDGTFTNVTAPSGLGVGGETQGNSAAWWDYDMDGWPDLYVANDFAVPDRLFRNNGDGTFTNVIDQVVPLVPYSSMGSDVGDVNNDGLMDFYVADMAATTVEKDQRSMADTRGRTRDPAEGAAAVPNYLRNALFINTATGRMLEAAYLTGLAATDWTWSVRWEDLDNDGRVDLHVTNGMHREIHNTDLLHRMMTTEGAADRVRAARASPVLQEANLAYQNLGDFKFANVGAAWGLDQKGVSFGAAFGDLDGDGDLDLIYTNYEAGATLLRNDSDQGHRVTVALRGRGSNRFGIGATIRLETAGGAQMRQLFLARGYMSSSDPVAHFGLGEHDQVMRLTVRWPSGHEQTFTALSADHHYTITEPEGAPAPAVAPEPVVSQFGEVGARANLTWRAREEIVDEIAQQRLLPLRLNRRGPALAAGDIDGDGRDDLLLGGTTMDPARVLFNSPDGAFVLLGNLGGAGRAPVNDGPVLVFDANADGRSDVLITKGGNSLPAGSPEYQPQLYLGADDGLRPAPSGTLPLLNESIGAAAAVDFNGDGALDLFLGSRVSPGLYPLPPRSFLLEQRGGRFSDVTDERAPGLREVGMVTSALWSDVNGDGWSDLLVAVEWGPVRYFENEGGRRLVDRTEAAGFGAAGSGWWTALAAADFNGDGRLDYVAGNVGLNTQYQATPDEPALLLVSEPPDGGSLRLFEARHEGPRIYPWRSRRDLASVLPTIPRRFPRNDLFARATLEQVLGPELMASAERFAATELRSGVFLSEADGRHRFAPLPRLVQIAPVQGVVAGDFTGDGHADLFVVQNSYAPSPVVGRFNGGLSQLLAGDGRGGFGLVPPVQSGLIIPGDAKALVAVDLQEDGWADFVVTRNSDTTLAFQNRGVAGGRALRVELAGSGGNRRAVGARLELVLRDGRRQFAEVHAGSGWLSQSSSSVFFGYPEANPPQRLVVRWPHGPETNHALSSPEAVLRVAQP